MFSGIVERVGSIAGVTPVPEGIRFTVAHGFGAPEEAGSSERGLHPGDSVAVNGVCLTAERTGPGTFDAVAIPETLGKTLLGGLRAGDRVNLERALRVGDPLGGHWVQGHVDGIAVVRSATRTTEGVRVAIEIPEPYRRYVATKGSIAIDGVSLTVAAWDPPVLTVALVPFTLENTVAGDYAAGSRVHFEIDLIARYLERLLEARGIAGEPAAGPSPLAGGRR